VLRLDRGFARIRGHCRLLEHLSIFGEHWPYVREPLGGVISEDRRYGCPVCCQPGIGDVPSLKHSIVAQPKQAVNQYAKSEIARDARSRLLRPLVNRAHHLQLSPPSLCFLQRGTGRRCLCTKRLNVGCAREICVSKIADDVPMRLRDVHDRRPTAAALPAD
jgi:hypothetical protein